MIELWWTAAVLQWAWLRSWPLYMWLLSSVGCPPLRLVGKSPSSSLGSPSECHRTTMVMSRPVSMKTQDFPSQKKHVMFQFSSKCSQQDPFPFLLEKISKWEYSEWDLVFWCGGQGGADYYQTKWSTELFWNVLSGVWAEPGVQWSPLFPIDLRSWQVGPSLCEVGSRRTKRAHTGCEERDEKVEAEGGRTESRHSPPAPLCLKLPLAGSCSHIHYSLFVTEASWCCEPDEWL